MKKKRERRMKKETPLFGDLSSFRLHPFLDDAAETDLDWKD